MAAIKKYGVQAFWVTFLISALVVGVVLINRVEQLQDELDRGFLILQEAESTEEIDGITISAMATQVAQAEERALGYLGIFESVGVAITVLGIIGAILGLVLGGNVRDAQKGFADAQNAMRILEQRNEEFNKRNEIILESVEKRYQELSEKQTIIENLEQRNEELSRILYEKVAETTKQSNIAQFYVVIARTQAELGDLTGAMDTYKRAKDLIPDNPVPHYHIGYILTQLNRFDEAEAILNEALALDSSFPNAKAALGFVYRRRWDNLVKEIHDKKLELSPEIEEELNRYAEYAQKYIDEALRAAPKLVDDNGESWHGSLGGLYRRQKNLVKAAYHYDEATKVTRQSSYPLLNLTMIEWEQGHVNKLIPQLERVAELVKRKITKDKDTYWDRADLMNVQLALGENEEALVTLKAFLQVMPPEAKDVLERVISSTEFIRNAPPPPIETRDLKVIDEVLRQLRAAAGIEDKNGAVA